ncbi:MAG: DUF3501 family protein [Rhodocyclales bacterium]|nr:DUF3501 family protein [Rhodocyclales bacterium]
MLTPADLYSLEHYARIRADFRARVIAHKQRRRLALGEHAALCFEDALTVRYQVQEMLRIERIFEPQGIQHELDVYNPLLPDGSNWKATFMLEYGDEAERRRALAQLVGVEACVWLQVAGCAPVRAIADEDLGRSTADKTSAVHFLRFELTPAMVAAVKAGVAIQAGIDHRAFQATAQVPEALRASLAADLA